MTHTPRLNALDGLRAIAVLAVVVYHVNADWLPGGFLGVDIFFAMSGYLITSGLLRDRAKGSISLERFWGRRLRRLLPALWTMLLIVTAALMFFPPDLRVALGRQLLGAFTYTSNWISIAAADSYFTHDTPLVFVHLWSLAIEEQFYLVWPLLLVFWPRRWGRGIGIGVTLTLALASAALMAVQYVPGADPSAVYFGTLTHSFGLMFGAALAFARPLYSEHALTRWGWSGKAVSSIWVNTVAVVLALGLALALYLVDDQSSWTYRGGIAAASLLAVALIATFGDDRSVVTRGLETRPMRWIGQRSYGIYLWHWPVILMVRQLLPGEESFVRDLGVLMLGGTISVAAAAVSFRRVEQPILRLGVGETTRLLRRTIAGATRSRWAITGTALVISVLAVASLLRSPQQSSAQQYVQSGAAYAQPAALPQLQVDGAQPPEPLFPPADPITSAQGADMLAAGDSVMLASAPALTDAFPGITIDAEVARQSTDTFAAARDRLTADRSRRVVIVHTGTNGGIDQGELESFINWVGPTRRVVLVDIYADRSWQDADNTMLNAIAAAHPGSVAVAQWHATIAGHVDELAGDHIHPGPAAADRYVQAVRDAVNGLGIRIDEATGISERN